MKKSRLSKILLVILFLAVIVSGSAFAVNSSKASVSTTTLVLPHVFVYKASIMAQTKQNLNSDAVLKSSLQQLTQQADSLLSAQPHSVMEKTQLPASGNKHDYLSLAPYWWPDPNSPNGLPYIHKDGQTNPEVNTIRDKTDFNNMMDSVKTLALAYYYTGNETYAKKATDFLTVWFLNNATYMNPNLNYAQMIKGVNTGDKIGIIDSRGLSHIVDDIGLLQGSASWTAQDQQGMQNWFSQYLNWLLTSPFGQQEGQATNNHGTWYDVQVASIALFVNQTATAHSTLQNSAARHIDGHINADGSQPLETSRTLSWHYSVFNLAPLFFLASLGDDVGVNLWDYKNSQGASIQTALNFVIPAALNQQPWPYQQIKPIVPGELTEVLFEADAHYQQASYLKDAQLIDGSSANSDLDNLLYGDGNTSSATATPAATSTRIAASPTPTKPGATPTPTKPGATATPTKPGATATPTKPGATPTRSVPTPTPSGIAPWAPGISYNTGTLVTYQGHTYKCLQAHTSQTGWEPSNVPALWQKIN